MGSVQQNWLLQSLPKLQAAGTHCPVGAEVVVEVVVGDAFVVVVVVVVVVVLVVVVVVGGTQTPPWHVPAVPPGVVHGVWSATTETTQAPLAQATAWQGAGGGQSVLVRH